MSSEVTEAIHAQQEWEYRFYDEKSLSRLKSLVAESGTEGWELVNVVLDRHDPATWHAFLKRPAAYGEAATC